MWLGVDTGGTFTDFVLLDDAGDLRIHKVLSTPAAPEQAILQGLNELGISGDQQLRIVHGSTVATNAVLEGKGASTAYVTNRGLGDVLTIGRQARRELYNLQPPRPRPPVPRELCLETGGRLAADGAEIEALTDADLNELVIAMQKLAPEAVAINLLFSFVDSHGERRIEAALREAFGDTLFISRSSAVLPEYREYERGITTWLNSYTGPRVQGYLQRLGRNLDGQLGAASLAVMRSSGETCAADQAGQEAVHLLVSGPAGGLAAARYLAGYTDTERVLTFDMGGTSTDVAMIDGDIRLTSQGHIGPYPVAVPMVDLHTIGAGGGSIARVDAGGLLQVGPASAGADPGPACYGRGGQQATVTDANVVLGRLPAAQPLGGSMALDVRAARDALDGLAKKLGLGSPQEAAEGVIRVANEHMAQALRVISVQRGLDPRDFTLISFGGAGGLHVCALAEMLGMSRALAPIHGGVLSALGMLTAPRGRQLSRTLALDLAGVDAATVDAALAELADSGRQALVREGLMAADLEYQPSLDLCYRGQSYTLNVPWSGIAECEEAFHAAHEQRYGHRLHTPVQLVNVRLAVRAPAQALTLPRWQAVAGIETGESDLYGIDGKVPVWSRSGLMAGHELEGPVIVTEGVSTLYLTAGWRAVVDAVGNLLLERFPASDPDQGNSL